MNVLIQALAEAQLDVGAMAPMEAATAIAKAHGKSWEAVKGAISTIASVQTFSPKKEATAALRKILKVNRGAFNQGDLEISVGGGSYGSVISIRSTKS